MRGHKLAAICGWSVATLHSVGAVLRADRAADAWMIAVSHTGLILCVAALILSAARRA